jgi:hypothetical protein
MALRCVVRAFSQATFRRVVRLLRAMSALSHPANESRDLSTSFTCHSWTLIVSERCESLRYRGQLSLNGEKLKSSRLTSRSIWRSAFYLHEFTRPHKCESSTSESPAGMGAQPTTWFFVYWLYSHLWRLRSTRLELGKHLSPPRQMRLIQVSVVPSEDDPDNCRSRSRRIIQVQGCARWLCSAKVQGYRR